jgi:hypothetical protein
MCAFLVLCLFSVAHAQIDKKVDISWVYMSKHVACRPPQELAGYSGLFDDSTNYAKNC